MSDVIQLRCEIGGTDYGPAGQQYLKPGFRLTSNGPGSIGGGQIALESTPGGDAAIVNQMLVHLYFFNVTQNRIWQELFIGTVSARTMGQAPGSSVKTWAIELQDMNVQLDALVGDATGAGQISLSADTFPNQIASLFTQLTTGAALGLDASTYVLDCAAGQTLPAVPMGGQTLGTMLGTIFAAARRQVPASRPVATITPDPALLGPIGATWQPPVLQVWDAASPPTPSVKFSNAGPDTHHFAILPDQPFDRRIESPRLVNWRQMYAQNGVVYTGQDATSIATYPNPFDKDGAWKGPAVHDTGHLPAGVVATAHAVRTGGAISSLVLDSGGTNYYDPPGVRVVGGGTPTRVAVYIATVDGSGHVNGLIKIDGGAGYSSTPTVAFDDAVQLAINGQVATTSTPRERLTILTDTPAMAGTYVAVTLTLEAGLVEVAYLVNAITADFSAPARPVYVLELGARALRLGEQAGDDVYAAPVEGVRLGPPTNLAQTSQFLPYQGTTEIDFTFDPPTAPPGSTLTQYILHVRTAGFEQTQIYPASGGGTLAYVTSPGRTVDSAWVVAYASGGLVSAPSTAIGPFTVAGVYAPDKPTSLSVTTRGVEANGKGWALIGFTPPGTTHGPHDQYEVRVVGGGLTWSPLRYPGTVSAVQISGFTLGVTYTVDIRSLSNPTWYGAYSSTVSVVIKPNSGPPIVTPGSATAPDAALVGWTPSSTTKITLDATNGYKTGAAYKITPSVSSSEHLDRDPLLVQPGLSIVTVQAYYKRDTAALSSAQALWRWYDNADPSAGGATLLHTDTDTLSPTTSYQEYAMKRPGYAGALSLVILFVATTTGSASSLWVDCPVPPQVAIDSPQLGLRTGLAFHDPVTGATLSTATVDPATGTTSITNTKSTSDTTLEATTVDATAIHAVSQTGAGLHAESTDGNGVEGTSVTETGGSFSSDTNVGAQAGSNSGIGLIGGSLSNISVQAQSLDTGNTEPTLVTKRLAGGTADLFQAQADDGTPLVQIGSVGALQLNAGELQPAVVKSGLLPFPTLDNTERNIEIYGHFGNVTINLPPAASYPGLIYHFTLMDNPGVHTVTIQPDSGNPDMIESAASVILTTQWDSLQIRAAMDGATWVRVR